MTACISLIVCSLFPVFLFCILKMIFHVFSIASIKYRWQLFTCKRPTFHGFEPFIFDIFRPFFRARRWKISFIFYFPQEKTQLGLEINWINNIGKMKFLKKSLIGLYNFIIIIFIIIIIIIIFIIIIIIIITSQPSVV